MAAPRSIFQSATAPGNMKVVRHDPIKERKLKTALIVGFFIATGSAYWLGGRISDTEAARLNNENIVLNSQRVELKAENEKLAQRLAILERTAKVDQEAIKNVRTLIRQLEDEKALLNKDLTFYKSILAPEDLNQGVKVQTLDIQPAEAENQYQFRLVMSQVARDNPFLKGTLTVDLAGSQNGNPKTLSLLELAGMEKSVDLGFRYFQSFPDSRDYVTMELPEDFEPETIQVAVKVRSGRVKSMKQQINWQQKLGQ